ncbi:MAG: hypothetical protein EHM21_02260 [Chloroflexi bacterium]|nr:MAG: hypothetical protein EHM21_02260 [Chloroflexota bacterium]
MCCFFMVLMFLGPRVAFLVYWLIPAGRLQMQMAFNTWIWPVLGVIFLPWTTLMYTFVYGANGMVGFDWVWVGLALAVDIATYAGGGYKRRSVPGYPTTAP